MIQLLMQQEGLLSITEGAKKDVKKMWEANELPLFSLSEYEGICIAQNSCFPHPSCCI